MGQIDQHDSDASEVKETKARVAGVVQVFGLLVGSVTDWIGLGIVGYAWLFTNKLASEAAVPIVVALCTGTIVAKVRGSKGGSSSAFLMAGPTVKFATMAVGAFRMHGLAVLLALASVICGCAAFRSPDRVIKTVEDVAVVLCDIFATSHPEQLGGISPAMFCASAENVSAFYEPAALALSSGGELALKRGAP